MSQLVFNSFQKQLISLNQKKPSSLVLPEGDDPRVLAAASLLLQQNCLETLILLGSLDKLQQVSADAGITLDFSDSRLKIGDRDVPELTKLSQACCRDYLKRRGKPVSEDAVLKWASHPANQAASLLYHDRCKAALAGCVFTTADVIRGALQGVGLREGNRTISGSFAMVREERGDDRRYMFADCGVVIEPSVEQLVDIAFETVQTFRQLFPDLEPKVAFLSFSTKGSAKHHSADKMVEATKAFQEKHPDIKADGEMQFDAAIVPAVGERKSPGSPVAGQANCFIFPNLDAGNLVYKVTQRLAGFDAYGPILQGTKKPYSDLSRGASAEDIFISSLITMLRAQ
ncbi:phosphotransacetylase [Pseudobacteriovorax antillogorgiicola]|uniref:Phosphotransacetylase n=1 Tax=Pseudobacteriovorax antillogorgiicola TaxID=1513793 RepID=A0A1Y6B757_9BACT|nr:phosphotransacetylase [Pseudobacteriovorax antillogorgiicola]TCS58643.1 phosphotransacetylase [Pseudobacteriovorax antillogorgiicola]SME96474.1 phosphotransacetylase [Pseudobacteriovorax antillogorgiicola]